MLKSIVAQYAIPSPMVDDILVVSWMEELTPMEPIYVLEYKQSGREFHESLLRYRSLRLCQQSLTDALGTGWWNDNKLKVYVEPHMIAGTHKHIELNGILINGVRLHIRDLKPRHVVVSEAYRANVLRATNSLPRKLQVVVKAEVRVFVEVAAHLGGDVARAHFSV